MNKSESLPDVLLKISCIMHEKMNKTQLQGLCRRRHDSRTGVGGARCVRCCTLPVSSRAEANDTNLPRRQRTDLGACVARLAEVCCELLVRINLFSPLGLQLTSRCPRNRHSLGGIGSRNVKVSLQRRCQPFGKLSTRSRMRRRSHSPSPRPTLTTRHPHRSSFPMKTTLSVSDTPDSQL
jgi:hypothetical protein